MRTHATTTGKRAAFRATRRCSVRATQLAAALTIALGVGGMASSLAATIPVTSCADDGSFGTLRHAVLTAVSGDTVDLSALTCSTITLTSGEVHIDVDPLTIQGPGAAKLTIDGNHADRVFYHSGTGTFTVSDVTLANGTTSGAKAYGGCVYSKGDLVFESAALSACMATGTTPAAGGGAVAVHNITFNLSTATGCTATSPLTAKGGALLAGNTASLTFSTLSGNSATATGSSGMIRAYCGGAVGGKGLALFDSTLSGNLAQASNGTARGGGGCATTYLTAKYSTITGNQAYGKLANPDYGAAGGLYGITLSNNALIANSTIDHNRANLVGGALLAGTGTATILQSTISSNTATVLGGGLGVSMNLTLSNSTIAFNTAGPQGAGGLFIGSGYTADLESSILADNSPSGAAGGADLAGKGTVTGSHNLVKISSLPVPADTLTADPKLGPLACNGGSTRTHALLPSSPAIDTGAIRRRSSSTSAVRDSRARSEPGPTLAPMKAIRTGSSPTISIAEGAMDHDSCADEKNPDAPTWRTLLSNNGRNNATTIASVFARHATPVVGIVCFG